MDYLDDDRYEPDERGMNGFERAALEFLDGFLEKLLQGARVYRMGGSEVMTLHQLRQVLLDFGAVTFDGHVRISSRRDDMLGLRESVLEVSPSTIAIGVQGIDRMESGGESYFDIYFTIGSGDESDTLDDDLYAWEEEFFDKLTYPDAKVVVEGEVMNIRESEFGSSDEEESSSDTPY
ncbi:MAG: hypothetical protein RL021_1438 [Bacteroidota bacterium]|jgi:hypothetical protein